MFRWEPEGRKRYILCTAIVPFLFSADLLISLFFHDINNNSEQTSNCKLPGWRFVYKASRLLLWKWDPAKSGSPGPRKKGGRTCNRTRSAFTKTPLWTKSSVQNRQNHGRWIPPPQRTLYVQPFGYQTARATHKQSAIPPVICPKFHPYIQPPCQKGSQFLALL